MRAGRKVSKVADWAAWKAGTLLQVRSDLTKAPAESFMLGSYVLGLYANFVIKEKLELLWDREVYDLVKISMAKNPLAIDVLMEVKFRINSTPPREELFDLADSAIYFGHLQTLNLVLTTQFGTWKKGPDTLKVKPYALNSHNRNFFTKLLICYEKMCSEPYEDMALILRANIQTDVIVSIFEEMLFSIEPDKREELLKKEFERISTEFRTEAPVRVLGMMRSYMENRSAIDAVLEANISGERLEAVHRLSDESAVRFKARTTEAIIPSPAASAAAAAVPMPAAKILGAGSEGVELELFPRPVKLSRDAAIGSLQANAAEHITRIIRSIEAGLNAKGVKKADLKQSALRGFREVFLWPDPIYVSLSLFLVLDWLKKAEMSSKIFSEDDLIELLRDDRKRTIVIDFLIEGSESRNDLILMALDRGYPKLARLLILKEAAQLETAELAFVKMLFSNETNSGKSFVQNTLNYIERTVNKINTASTERERLSFQRSIAPLKLRLKSFLTRLSFFPEAEEEILRALLRSLISGSKTPPVNALEAISECTVNEKLKFELRSPDKGKELPRASDSVAALAAAKILAPPLSAVHASMEIFNLYKAHFSAAEGGAFVETTILQVLNSHPVFDFSMQSRFEECDYDLASCAIKASHFYVLRSMLINEREASSPQEFLVRSRRENSYAMTWFSKWLSLVQMYYQEIKDLGRGVSSAEHQKTFKELVYEFNLALAMHPIESRLALLQEELLTMRRIGAESSHVMMVPMWLLRLCMVQLKADTTEIDALLAKDHGLEQYALTQESLQEAEDLRLRAELLKAISSEDTASLARLVKIFFEEEALKVFVRVFIFKVQCVDLKAIYFLLGSLNQDQSRLLIDYKLEPDNPLSLLDQIILWASYEQRDEYNRAEAKLSSVDLDLKSNEDVDGLRRVIDVVLRQSFVDLKAQVDYLCEKFKPGFNNPAYISFSAFMIASVSLLTEVQAIVKSSTAPISRALDEKRSFFFLRMLYQHNFEIFVQELNRVILSACVNPKFNIENFCQSFWRANLFFDQYRPDGSLSADGLLEVQTSLGIACDLFNYLLEAIVTRHQDSRLAKSLLKFLVDARYFSSSKLEVFVSAARARSSLMQNEATQEIFKLYEARLNGTGAPVAEATIVALLGSSPSCDFSVEYDFLTGDFDLASCALAAEHFLVLKMLLSRERNLDPEEFVDQSSKLNQQWLSWFSKYLLLIEMYYQRVKDAGPERLAIQQKMFKELVGDFCSAVAAYPKAERLKLLQSEFKIISNPHRSLAACALFVLKVCLEHLKQDTKNIDALLPKKLGLEKYNIAQVVLAEAEKIELAEASAISQATHQSLSLGPAVAAAAAGAGASAVSEEVLKPAAASATAAAKDAYNALSIDDLLRKIDADSGGKTGRRRAGKVSASSNPTASVSVAAGSAESSMPSAVSPLKPVVDPDPALAAIPLANAVLSFNEASRVPTEGASTSSASDDGSDNPDVVSHEVLVSEDPSTATKKQANAKGKVDSLSSKALPARLSEVLAERKYITPENLVLEEFKALRGELSKLLFEWSSELSGGESDEFSKKLLVELLKRQNHLKTIAAQFKKTKSPRAPAALILDEASITGATYAGRYSLLATKLLESSVRLGAELKSGYLLEAVAALQVPLAIDGKELELRSVVLPVLAEREELADAAAAALAPAVPAEVIAPVAVASVSTETLAPPAAPAAEAMRAPLPLELRLRTAMPIVESLKALLIAEVAEFATLVMPGSQHWLPYPLDIDLRMGVSSAIAEEKIEAFKARLCSVLHDRGGFEVLKKITVPDGSGVLSIKLAARGSDEGYDDKNHMSIDLVVFTNPAKKALNHTSCSSSELNLLTYELLHDDEVITDIANGIFSIKKRPLGDPGVELSAQIHILKLLSRAWSESCSGRMRLDENSINLMREIIEARSDLKLLNERNPLLARALKEWVSEHFSAYQQGINFERRTAIVFNFLEHLGMGSSVPFMTKVMVKIIANDFRNYKTGELSFKQFDELNAFYVARGWPFEELRAAAIQEVLAQHLFSYFLTKDANYFNKLYLLLGDLKLEPNRALMRGAFRLAFEMYFKSYQTAADKGDLRRLIALLTILKLPNSQRPAMDAIFSESLRALVQEHFDTYVDSKKPEHFIKTKALIEFCKELGFSLAVPLSGIVGDSFTIINLNAEKTRTVLSAPTAIVPTNFLSLSLNAQFLRDDEEFMGQALMLATMRHQVSGVSSAGFFSGSVPAPTAAAAAGAGAVSFSPYYHR